MAFATSFAPCEKESTMAVKICTYLKNCSARGSWRVTLSWIAATFASVSKSLCVSLSNCPMMYDMPDFFFSFSAGSASLVFSSSAASFRTPDAARSASALLAPTTSPLSILFERVGTMAPATTPAAMDGYKPTNRAGHKLPALASLVNLQVLNLSHWPLVPLRIQYDTLIQTTTKTINGKKILHRKYASPLITANFTIPYKIAAQMPDAMGDRNQDATISATPSNQGKFSKAMFVVPFP